MGETPLLCPVCALEHTTADRVDHDGGKECPRCGERTAVLADANTTGAPHA